MDIDLTKRGILTMFFRRCFTFFFICIGVIFCTGAYLFYTAPLYSASGSLLVKFGIHATPAVSTLSDNRSSAEEDHASALASNVELIKSRTLLRDVVNSFGIEKLYPGLTAETAEEDSPLESAINRILKKDLVIRAEQQGDIITLTYTNKNPELAAQFLQRLMDAFIERHMEYYKKPPTEFLAQQIKNASDKLTVSQRNLEEFKEKSSLSSFENELQQLLQEKADVQTAALQGIDEARAKLDDLRLKESDLLNTYRADSPTVIDLRRNIRVAEDILRTRQDDLKVSNEIPQGGIITKPENVITNQMMTINHRIAEIEAQRHSYDDLFRQVQIDEDNYKSYMEHGEQARIDESLNKDKLTSISIIDSPVVPQKPSHPKKLLFMLLSILGGLVLAAWSVIILERSDDRFTTPEQVSGYLGVPVLASFLAPTRTR